MGVAAFELCNNLRLGMRIVLDEMRKDPNPVAVETQGTVKGRDDAGSDTSEHPLIETETLGNIRSETDEGLILRPDNGNGESLVTKDMYVGKEIIAFPYMWGMVKPVLQYGKKIVILVAIALIAVGCWERRQEIKFLLNMYFA